MTGQSTRRAILAGAACLPALALPAPATSAPSIHFARPLATTPLLDAYLEWLDNEHRVLQAELYPEMTGFKYSPVNTLARNFHFPAGGDWRAAPQPSTRARQVLETVGVLSTMPAEPDPIFDAIDTHKSAFIAWMRASSVRGETVDAEWAEEFDAEKIAAADAVDHDAYVAATEAALALTTIAPTSAAGIAALGAYVSAFNNGEIEPPDLSDCASSPSFWPVNAEIPGLAFESAGNPNIAFPFAVLDNIRRAMLSDCKNSALRSVPDTAVSATKGTDPAFAAIKRFRKENNRFSRHLKNEPRHGAAGKDEWLKQETALSNICTSAFEDMVSTVPTTRAGIDAMIAAFLKDADGEIADGDAATFICTLRKAVQRVA